MDKAYLEFLEKKRHTIGDFGFEPNFIPDIAFDFQKAIIERAVKKGRMAIGIELKDSYFKQAKINLSLAEKRFEKEFVKQETLFENE